MQKWMRTGRGWAARSAVLLVVAACSSGADDLDPTPVCGNGVVDVGEECDDGDGVDENECTNACNLPICGDGITTPSAGEGCDDGNDLEFDACTNRCTRPVCGDGVVTETLGEECDDGNRVNEDECTNACALPRCGDGVVSLSAGEDCDDRNTVDSDECTNACRAPECGDGILTTLIGEECDDGNLIDDATCTRRCTTPVCGDNIVTPGEECDDGNEVDDDACRTDCTLPFCGDGLVSFVVGVVEEQCDDGNVISGDGCDENCLPTQCGNGIVTGVEQCDDGNQVSGDGCSSNCAAEFACGDGVVEPGEGCDDGNFLSGDGCSAFCTTEACGNGVVDVGEDCDDGNRQRSDGCNQNCLLERFEGVDYASFGRGGIRAVQNPQGTAEIVVESITGTVTRALLFWHGPARVRSTGVNARIRLNGRVVVGTNIGVADDNCWGTLRFVHSHGYRADVTDLVRGNGRYRIDDLVGAAFFDINGLSLMLFYDDGRADNDVDVDVFEGNDSNFDSPFEPGDWRQPIVVPNATRTSTLSLELHVSDGQAFMDAALTIDGRVFVPGDDIFDGTTVPNGPSAGSTAGGLWDIIVYPRFNQFLGTTTSTIPVLLESEYTDDCLSLIAAAVIRQR